MKYIFNKNIAIITTLYHQDIVTPLLQKTIERLQSISKNSVTYTIFEVPGALEIPFATKLCIEQGYDGIITLGSIIRGETSHYELVSETACTSIHQLMLTYNKPIIFGVLTTNTKAQAMARIDGTHSNMGYYAADSLCKLFQVQAAIQQKSETSQGVYAQTK